MNDIEYICEQCEVRKCMTLNSGVKPDNCLYNYPLRQLWQHPNKRYEFLSDLEIEELKKEAVEEYLKKLSKAGIDGANNANSLKEKSTAFNKSDIQPKDIQNPDVFAAVVEKEPELMTLQEAMGKINPGDKIKTKEGIILIMGSSSIMIYFNTVLKDKPVELNQAIFKMEWQIIPAEPKVLTADEWLNSDDRNLTTSWRNVFKAGEENQWLNHKELREESEIALDHLKAMSDSLDIVNRLNRALRNLKPLKSQ